MATHMPDPPYFVVTKKQSMLNPFNIQYLLIDETYMKYKY
jgi:hypothetical protein